MSKDKSIVLLVDDEEKILASMTGLLQKRGFAVISTTRGDSALPLIEKNNVDLVILDLVMPGPDGITVLKDIHEKHPSLPVIMLTGHGTIAKAVEATKLGAFDFLEKPVESEKILITIDNALKKFRLEKEKATLIRDALERYRMVGVSDGTKEVFRLIEKVASSDSTVLITGESGTGKELIARAIHLRSERAGGPFLAVNCASIPDDLIESELFGHEKGAFTGAVERQVGKFEQSTGGTLFLDEIGDMSSKIQAKVLRAIEERCIQRVGGSEAIDIDLRIIAASNQDLRRAVREKTFREDLYFRLSVINVHVPPLRERKEDIPLLVDYFLKTLSEERKRPVPEVYPAALELLIEYAWPGNVRELRNLIEKALVLTSNDILSRDEVASYLKDSSLEEKPDINGLGTKSLSDARKRAEKSKILSCLLANKWNYEKAASDLSISRATLFNKIRELGIRRV